MIGELGEHFGEILLNKLCITSAKVELEYFVCKLGLADSSYFAVFVLLLAEFDFFWIRLCVKVRIS